MSNASTRFAPFLLMAGLLFSACNTQSPQTPVDGPTSESFGQTPEGTPVHTHLLRNANGIELRATNYGGIITSLRTPDADGNLADIVLGFDDLQSYADQTVYFGAIIGRFGNRIAEGRFELDGETHQLTVNDGPNHLHGGDNGFHKVVWDAEPFEGDGERGIVFTYTEPDGTEGYPGTLRTRVTYTLTDDDELILDYEATTDRATPINLTQHTYFNLAGHDSGDILSHELMIDADHITPVGETLIPTGELQPVDNTAFDFREPTAIGDRIDADDQQMRYGQGYDHNFVLNGSGLRLVASVYEPTSGRVLEVLTEEPGVQFYSGNFLAGEAGKDGAEYGLRTGFCLETQHYPDSPNQPNFPSTILQPDETYQTRTIYKFSAERR